MINELTNEEIAKLNEQIAYILGFELFDPGEDSGSPIQWIYPKEWEFARYSVPTTMLPDFIKMINDRIETIDNAGGIVPKDIFTDKNRSKTEEEK